MFWTGELIARNAPIRRRVGPAARESPHIGRGHRRLPRARHRRCAGRHRRVHDAARNSPPVRRAPRHHRRRLAAPESRARSPTTRPCRWRSAKPSSPTAAVDAAGRGRGLRRLDARQAGRHRQHRAAQPDRSSARPATRKRPPPNTTPATAPRCAFCRWRWPRSVRPQEACASAAAPRPTSRTTTSSPTPPAKPWPSWCTMLLRRPRHRRGAARARRPNSCAAIRCSPIGEQAASRTRAATSSTPCRRYSSRFFDTDVFEDCLIDVVNRGGDADTTGAIAGMLAGARYGLASGSRAAGRRLSTRRWPATLRASHCPAGAGRAHSSPALITACWPSRCGGRAGSNPEQPRRQQCSGNCRTRARIPSADQWQVFGKELETRLTAPLTPPPHARAWQTGLASTDTSFPWAESVRHTPPPGRRQTHTPRWSGISIVG